MTTDAREETDGSLAGVDCRPERAAAAVHEMGADIQRQQVARALAALEAAGGLTDCQRAAVEQLADRLVDRLLEPPTTSLAAAAADANPGEVAVALDLFDARDVLEGTDE